MRRSTPFFAKLVPPHDTFPHDVLAPGKWYLRVQRYLSNGIYVFKGIYRLPNEQQGTSEDVTADVRPRRCYLFAKIQHLDF